MCGIVGVLGSEPVASKLIAALKQLEYRGYDSAGVATTEGRRLERRRAAGKIRNLEAELIKAPLLGRSGIGHTRWATHGPPTVSNAHPHQAGRVAIVHNGIIENFRELRTELSAGGHVFESDTDSEVIAALIEAALAAGASPVDAVKRATKRMRGAYAIAALFEGEDDLLIGARRGSPLVAGFGAQEAFLGSDAIAVSSFTRKFMYLEEGDLIALSRDKFEMFDGQDRPVTRPISEADIETDAIEKGEFPHYMLKEIHEQPAVIARTTSRYVDALDLSVSLPGAEALDFAKMRRLHIIACGTAHFAGRVAKYWFERIAGLPVECEIGSEYRYRAPVIDADDAALVISQSGETADTLAGLRLAQQAGIKTIGVLNVPTSSMARACDLVLPTLAGAEIGVASTKAFTCQLTTLAAMAVAAARARGAINRSEEAAFARALLEAPRLVTEALKTAPAISRVASKLARAKSVLYLGRDTFFPLALEAALKLKEISYIHAEGYASGELKHGPIALIDSKTPVVMLAPYNALFEKALSNLQEICARGAKVVLISDAAGLEAAGDDAFAKILMPEVPELIAPIVYSAPVQLLAYSIALKRGADIDQPRNLAKSVTVE
jgi:glucosamine--fructose-6-phosphate aminotransferase (isomerizing)